MAARKGLGRGLDSMFPRYTEQTQGTASGTKTEANSKSEQKKQGTKQNTKKNGTKNTEKKSKKVSNQSKETFLEDSEDNIFIEDAETSEIVSTEPSVETTMEETVSSKPEINVVEHSVKEPDERSMREDGTLLVKLSEIEPNADQPRREFNEDALQELAESIRQVGIIQPIVVQKREDYYEIIAGERRWRAARLAGLKEVPVIVKDLSDKEILELSLIENLQREDLNPIEEAKAYKRLIEEFDLKQDELAERLSKSRTAITNSMRLLKLCDKVQEMLISDMISAGHARALLALEDPAMQEAAAMQVFDEKLSVRETEKLVKALQKPRTEKKETIGPDEATRLIYKDMEDNLRAALGTKVTVHYGSGQKGKLEIEYYSSDELERIYDLLRYGTGL